MNDDPEFKLQRDENLHDVSWPMVFAVWLMLHIALACVWLCGLPCRIKERMRL